MRKAGPDRTPATRLPPEAASPAPARGRTAGAPVDLRLLRHAAAARRWLALTAALGLTTTGLVLAQACLLARALAGAARGTGLAPLSGTIITLLVVLIGRAAAIHGGETAALRAAAQVKSRLRRRLTEQALRLGPAWLSGQRAGEVTTVSTRGLDALDAYFARYLPQLLFACVVPLAVLVTVTAADWISGLIIAATLPLIPVFATLVGRYSAEHAQRQWRLLARLGGHFLDVAEGLPTLKVFGRASAQADVIKTVTGQHRAATMAALRIAFLSALVLELAAALATALVAVEVGLRLLAGHLSYQTALLVLLLTPEAYLPLRGLGAQFHASAEGTAAASRVFEILDLPASRARTADPSGPGPSANGHAARHDPDLRETTIALNAVTLAYPGRERPALSGVTLTISPGERIVLSGPSGAGKSSLLSLLLRFTVPTSGQITADGADLAAVPVSRWRRQIAWVPQSPYLFAGTVAENIMLGEPGAAPDAIARAARLAGADEFVATLPGGLDARLNERGLNLSAGQRQRLGLARAFLRDAPLVLLDEPVAHLDPVSARQILTTIEAVTAGRTVLVASHRERLPVGASKVLCLDHGRVAVRPVMIAGDEPDRQAAGR
ncbi:MAG TPA: thiol reductant ABC exporter subunit CydD [Streptosporangiaceae bacterium]|nr:thiol reductant ABC exporter subunit CydD [Streptosporangiaceae bacterium]